MSNEELKLLIFDFQNGKSDSFNNIVPEFENYIKFKAGSYKDTLARGFDYDDLVQEGLIGVWSASKKFKLESSYTIKAYFFSSIKNHMLKLIKTSNSKKNTSFTDSLHLEKVINEESGLRVADILPDLKSLTLDRILEKESLKQTLNTIKENFGMLTKRELIIFKYTLAGYTPAEIAESIGSTPHSVRTMQYKARQKYRKINFN